MYTHRVFRSFFLGKSKSVNLFQLGFFMRYTVVVHMCLVGPPNPYKLEQSWELTFLIGLTLLNTKLAKKIFFTDVL